MSNEKKNNDIRRSCVDCAASACDGKSGTYPDFCLTCELLEGEDSTIRDTLDK